MGQRGTEEQEKKIEREILEVDDDVASLTVVSFQGSYSQKNLTRLVGRDQSSTWSVANLFT